MNLYELIRALSGRLLDPARTLRWRPCPVCGAGVGVHPDGVMRLCLRCTEAEIGEPADELAERVSRRMTRRAYLALPRDDDGRPILPSLSYRQWNDLRR